LQSLSVHFLPALMHAESLSGGTAVIIDILRASSTITTALHHGASCVIPCGSQDEAREIRDESAAGSVLLGGERGGVLIEGFDCGNSPTEYPASRVAGKTIAFTTTNGTKALLKSAAAETILIGAFVNRQALAERLRADQRAVYLVCAGTDGEITGEDVLFAGAVVESLLASQQDRWGLNDSARIAQTFWQQSVSGETREALSVGIESAMRQTHGGRNLIDLGYDNDIKLCSAVDSIALVPVLRGNALKK
jgi:2-phosphosulfolactate phosphatase